MSESHNDRIAQMKARRAYWLPLPMRFLTAVGAVTARWGVFEMEFDATFRILGRHPEAAALLTRIPSSFKERSRLVRQITRICFRDTPSLSQKICGFSMRAYDLCKKRNILVHGFWFDMTPFEPEMGVIVTTKADGTGDIYSVTLEQVESLAEKIEDLRLERMMLTFPPNDADQENPYLTPSEVSALLMHHKDFPPPPAAPVLRDPKRKGSPQQPEPFRA